MENRKEIIDHYIRRGHFDSCHLLQPNHKNMRLEINLVTDWTCWVEVQGFPRGQIEFGHTDPDTGEQLASSH